MTANHTIDGEVVIERFESSITFFQKRFTVTKKTVILVV